jgi:hypothetical protein
VLLVDAKRRGAAINAYANKIGLGGSGACGAHKRKKRYDVMSRGGFNTETEEPAGI